MTTFETLKRLSDLVCAWENGAIEGTDEDAVAAFRDVLTPEPLTRERIWEWLRAERHRLAMMDVYAMTPEERGRENLLSASHDIALADLLVDAAAGMIK